MGSKYAPSWSAEFNLVLRSYPKVQTFRDGRDDHAASSRYLELVLDFEEKPHCKCNVIDVIAVLVSSLRYTST